MMYIVLINITEEELSSIDVTCSSHPQSIHSQATKLTKPYPTPSPIPFYLFFLSFLSFPSQFYTLSLWIYLQCMFLHSATSHKSYIPMSRLKQRLLLQSTFLPSNLTRAFLPIYTLCSAVYPYARSSSAACRPQQTHHSRQQNTTHHLGVFPDPWAQTEVWGP